MQPDTRNHRFPYERMSKIHLTAKALRNLDEITSQPPDPVATMPNLNLFCLKDTSQPFQSLESTSSITSTQVAQASQAQEVYVVLWSESYPSLTLYSAAAACQ